MEPGSMDQQMNILVATMGSTARANDMEMF
jgi:hypothetical protein